MDYRIGDLTKEETIYIGEKINEIVKTTMSTVVDRPTRCAARKS